MKNVVQGNFPKPKKKGLSELAIEIARAICLDGNIFSSAWPYTYHVIEPDRGTRLIVEEGDGDDEGVLTEVPLDHLTHRIVSWLSLQANPDWYLTFNKANEVAKTWRAMARVLPVGEVKSLRWAGEMGFAWHRLPWELKAGKCPTWDSLLEGFTNTEAFKAWIGSLFFDDSDRQQYCWIYGEGNDGKGAINRFLAKVLGKAFIAKQPPGKEDRFWTFSLFDKSLASFADCNNKSFVTSGLFKSMTGGDHISMEIKRGASFSAKLKVKFLILSNEKPSVSSEKSDRRRIIYLEAKDRDEDKWEKDFEDRLWAEGGALLTSCMETYQRLCPHRGPIPTNNDQINEWIETVEVQFEEIFDQHFRVNHDESEKVFWILPVELQRTLKTAIRDSHQRAEFMKWLKRIHGVKKHGYRQQTGANVIYVYRGLILKCIDRSF